MVLSSPTGADPRQTAGETPFSSGAKSPRLPAFVFELLEIAYNIPAFFRNLRLARQNNVRFIYERHAFFLFSTALVARILGLPLIVEVNELVGDPRIRAQPAFSWLAHWTDRFLFRRARLIAVVSPHLKRRVAQYGIPEERILVLPNAVSEAELAIPAGPPPFALQPAAFQLCFVGWLVEWHRLDFVIEALAAPEFAGVQLVLIGEGPLRENLAAQAQALGVKIQFAGTLPHAQIPAAVRMMDACVVPRQCQQ